MDKKKRKNIVIVSLFAVMLLMGVGYALLQQVLTINGTTTLDTDFNVYIESITPTESGLAESVSAIVGSDKLTASFEAKLMAPKDKVDYEIVVKNDGKIDAELTAVTNLTSEMPDYVTYTDNFVEGTILESGNSYTFTVTTKFNEDVTSINPEELTASLYTLSINCVQYMAPIIDPVERTVIATGDISVDDLTSNVTYTYYSDGALVISGTGYMFDIVEDMAMSPMKKMSVANQIVAYVLTNEDYDFDYTIDDIAQYSDSNGYKVDADFLDFVGGESAMLLANDKYFEANLPMTRDEIIESLSSDETSELYKLFQIIPPISSITIEEGVKSISNKFFDGLSYIDDLTIPKSVETIGDSAFIGVKIKNLVFEGSEDGTSNLNAIYHRAFAGNQIESLVLPSSLKILDDEAFSDNNITSLTVQGNYTTFYENAFSYNHNFTKAGVTLLNNPTVNGTPFDIDTNINWSYMN